MPSTAPQTKERTKRRFVPDDDTENQAPAQLIDPEAYDASEQQFAASLNSAGRDLANHGQAGAAPARFVLEEDNAPRSPAKIVGPSVEMAAGREPDGSSSPIPLPAVNGKQSLGNEVRTGDVEAQEISSPKPATEGSNGKEAPAEVAIPGQNVLPAQEDSATWRQEVAARLDNYQSRRGAQEPRYPSLRLKFESDPVAGKDSSVPEISSQPGPAEGAHSAAAAKRAPEIATEATGNEFPTRVIHFPRSAVAPPRPLEELAEPVLERPRILEAPEVAPIPPALGGMLIETAEEPKRERRPGFEIPLSPASMQLRMFAAGLDLVLVTFAVVLFGYIFFEMVDVTLSRAETAVAWLAFGIVFWAGYQYLLLVYSGTTPGLKLAGLQLTRFDDTPASQRSRRWRALASVLSVLSLGLGYAWCFLDEDQLCWHDRITGTYLSPHPPEPLPPVC